jgi:hypothetical protein
MFDTTYAPDHAVRISHPTYHPPKIPTLEDNPLSPVAAVSEGISSQRSPHAKDTIEMVIMAQKLLYVCER